MNDIDEDLDDDVDVDDDDDDVDLPDDGEMKTGRAELWTAAGGLLLAIITAAVSTAWWAGSNLATKEDIQAIQDELRQNRERSDDQMQELRGYIVDHLDGHTD